MGSHVNFKNVGEIAQTEGNGWNPTSNATLARQSSIYSLTFDEFQNTLGESGKEFGSMNMEDLLKSIWTAEESQSIATAIGSALNGNLQRQGSLTLPRTLSQKTVEEVWRDVFKDTSAIQPVSSSGGSNLGQREPTLGEMTLEEFLEKAGVVREDIPTSGRNNVCGGLPQQNVGGAGLPIEFQSQNHAVAGHEPSRRGNVALTSPMLGANTHGTSMIGAMSQQQPQQPQLQTFLPKQATLSFSAPSHVGNTTHLVSPRTKGSVVGMMNPLTSSSVQGDGISNGGLHRVTATRASPRNNLRCDVLFKSNLDSPSLSPSPSPLPCVFGEVGEQGRRSNASFEKVAERRRRRMIKNRESAARSRAMKQAYTVELEAEVATLKEMNLELRRKQQEILEMQKNQMLEAMKNPIGVKRRCLRRTCTGPW